MAACHPPRRKLNYRDPELAHSAQNAPSLKRAPKAVSVAQRKAPIPSLPPRDEERTHNLLPSTYRRRRRAGKPLETVEKTLTGLLSPDDSETPPELRADFSSAKGVVSGLRSEELANSETGASAAISKPSLDVSSDDLQCSREDTNAHCPGSEVADLLPSPAGGLDLVPLDMGPLFQRVDTAIVYEGPYPSFPRPLPEDCIDVCNRLSLLHGPLEEYAKHKVKRVSVEKVLQLEYRKNEDSTGVSGGPLSEGVQSLGTEVRRTVLDSLVGTILSQNTTDTNSRRAFASLKANFPTWESVYGADPKDVENAIRCGGLAEIKTCRILSILKTLNAERGKLCLEYIHELSADEIKLELSRFKGVGPKTIACVLMFHLQQNEFPVDTHVFRIAKMLGWVPEKADREKSYLHLNHRIPDHLKFDLHCLFVTHGKSCPRCAKGGRPRRPADGPCPLVNLKQRPIESLQSQLLSGPEEKLHE